MLPFLDIPVHYDHWSSWGQCLGHCGGTGTRQRIRGCHQIQFGIIHFSAKCPISGEQKEKCNGICQQTTVTKTTTTLGKIFPAALFLLNFFNTYLEVKSHNKFKILIMILILHGVSETCFNPTFLTKIALIGKIIHPYTVLVAYF